MRKADLAAFLFEKLVIQGCEQPGFDLRPVAKLMALPRPRVKGLLGQVARVVLVSGQAEGELIQRGIVLIHKEFKFLVGSHSTVVVIMSHRCANCSRKSQDLENRAS